MSASAQPPSAAPPPTLRPWLERWGRLLLVAVSLLLIAAVWAFRTAQMRHGLRAYQEAHSGEFRSREFPGLSARDLVLLGTAHSTDYRPNGSYTLVPEAKSPGTIRVGVFGCSFVRGAEVDEGADFPSRLSARLAERGHGEVEVINFGVGGYGMHQSVLLWQLVGRRYDLDYTLFHLYPFHERRDASFIQNAIDFAPVHSRFVLRDGEAVRIDPIGEDRLEAAEVYSRFLTPWRYARYDAHGPAFLRALLPRGKELGDNPFYYFPDGIQAESRKLYPALFSEVAQDGARGLIVVCNEARSCRHATALRRAGVEVLPANASDLARARPSLYQARLGHLGALGNELVGEELAARLSGDHRPRLALLEIEPLDAYPAAPAPERLRPGHRPALWIGSQRVATLLGGWPGGGRRRPFRAREAAALLDVTSGQEIVFLPLAAPLAGGEPLELSLRLDGRPVTAPLGEVEAAAPVLGRPRWIDGPIGGAGWSLDPAGFEPTGTITVLSERRVSDLAITLAGRPVLAGEIRPSGAGEQRFRLRPAWLSLVRTRADAPGVPSVRDLPPRGTVDLVLPFRNPKRNRGPLPRIPVAAYHRVTLRPRAPLPALARPLPPPGG